MEKNGFAKTNETKNVTIAFVLRWLKFTTYCFVASMAYNRGNLDWMGKSFTESEIIIIIITK